MTQTELEALVAEGHTVAEIAERAGWALSTTYTVLSRYRLRARHAGSGITAGHHLVVEPLSWYLDAESARAAIGEGLVGGRVADRWVVGRVVAARSRGWQAVHRAMEIGGVVIRPKCRLDAAPQEK